MNKITGVMTLVVFIAGITGGTLLNERVYRCPATEIVCPMTYGLSKVNTAGFQTRCYLNEEHTSWKVCRSGWEIYDYQPVEEPEGNGTIRVNIRIIPT